MLRNEALLLFPALLGGNGDLQKIVAFSGAFEKLFEIINQEGGTDGGIVVQDALTVVSGLLRFNVSNQASEPCPTRLTLRTTSENSPLYPPFRPCLASRQTYLSTRSRRTNSLCNIGRSKRSTMQAWFWV
jgi:hypothetical protein